MHAKQKDFAPDARGNPISAIALGNRLRVALQLVPKKPKRVLDIGCGEGYFLQLLAKEKIGRELFGADLSRKALESAKRNVPVAFTKLADARKLPFKGNFFDCVSALELLEHFSKPEEVLAEARRVLARDGTLLISTPNTSSILWNLVWPIWTLTPFGKKWRGEHVSNFTAKSLGKLLEKNGFAVSEKRAALFGCDLVFSAKKKSR